MFFQVAKVMVNQSCVSSNECYSNLTCIGPSYTCQVNKFIP